MGTFLLLLFIIFFVIPLLRIAFTVYTMRRKMRDAMRQMYDAQQGRQPESRQQRKGGWTAPGGKRKKIDGDIGEYVKFEELPADPDNRNGNAYSACVNPEPQVTDADWEEIR